MYIGLNPYCSGRWSRTALRQVSMGAAAVVLILIVVEDGLVQCRELLVRMVRQQS